MTGSVRLFSGPHQIPLWMGGGLIIYLLAAVANTPTTGEVADWTMSLAIALALVGTACEFIFTDEWGSDR